MQSSTAIAFRALIMLIFLISVPLLAIFGKDLPEVIKGLLDGRLSVQVTEQSKGAGAANGSPPQPMPTGATPGTVAAPPPGNPFEVAAPYRATPAVGQNPSADAAVGQVAPVNPATPPLMQPSGNLAGNLTTAAGPGTSPSPVMNAGLNSAGPGPISPSADWPAQSPTRPEAFQPSPETRPISMPELHQPSGVQESTAASANPAAIGGDNQFRVAESRLRELGATQYKLESWGPENKQYRFECRMAVAGNVGVNRHFQAIEDDPWRAMENVLSQVEQWQKN